MIGPMRSRPGELKIKTATDGWKSGSSGRQDSGCPGVKVQRAELHPVDWQQFESVSVCSFDLYQYEVIYPADLGPEIRGTVLKAGESSDAKIQAFF